MLLESLEIQNFRNLHGKLLFGNGLNIIFGDNGQGKTNWLEAIYTLATTKSFKTNKLNEAIKFDTDEVAYIRGTVHQGEHINRVIQVTLQNNSKILSVNGKKEAVTRYLGQLHAIIFNADEIEIIRGTPEFRRKFLDAGIVGIFPPFVRLNSAIFSLPLQFKARVALEAFASHQLEFIRSAAIVIHVAELPF